jgi:hypothetical protein
MGPVAELGSVAPEMVSVAPETVSVTETGSSAEVGSVTVVFWRVTAVCTSTRPVMEESVTKVADALEVRPGAEGADALHGPNDVLGERAPGQDDLLV